MPEISTDTLLIDINILIVDSNTHMRRMTRMMLMNLGARSVVEAADGFAALEAIRTNDPDVMLLDWELPVLNGIEVMRLVRSPGVFPRPKLPTIMLTYGATRAHILEALRVGVHEFLVKPTSAKALCDRLMSIVIKPRPMMTVGKYYVPKPRRMSLPHEPDHGAEEVIADTIGA
jgi:two-component system chemotaxis response regulator CheY